MNVHHLELFYYVALHGGISEAVRHFPYGIQQPAVSGQILQLEEHLGVTLFQRRPFHLTPAGEELFQFIQPFFGKLELMATKLQGGPGQHIRIGASEVVLRDHLPLMAQFVRHKFPHLKMVLREGYQPQVEGWLVREEIDLAITLLNDTPLAGLNSQPLLKMPLQLLVPSRSPLRSADDLWQQDKIEAPLITLTANEAICQHFQKGLARKGIDWFPSIEVSSLKLIETYVANGDGIGLFVEIPKTKLVPEVRPLRLSPPDFQPVSLAVLWRGRPTEVMSAFISASQMRAQELLA